MTDPSETLATEASVDDQIKALREKLEAQRAAREVETEPERKDREFKRLARDLKDEEQIADAERKYGAGNVESVRTDLGVVIVKKSNPLAFSAYIDKGDTSSLAQQRLVLPCLVNMRATEFEKLCEELPLTLIRVTDALYALAGAQQRALAGKS